MVGKAASARNRFEILPGRRGLRLAIHMARPKWVAKAEWANIMSTKRVVIVVILA